MGESVDCGPLVGCALLLSRVVWLCGPPFDVISESEPFEVASLEDCPIFEFVRVFCSMLDAKFSADEEPVTVERG